jgi:predicted Rossmann fold flavoprotein
MAPERFVTDSSPNTLRKILLSWPLAEQRRFFETEAGLPLALEEETGKLFPASNSAREVRDGLLHLAARKGVERRFGALVDRLEPRDEAWIVHLGEGTEIAASAVIIATGGLSLPGTGSDGLGFELMRRLGHTLHPPYPALTPLTADPPRHAALAGISLDVTLTAPRLLTTKGGFLFTHRGYSGPAVLDISHLAVRSKMAGGPPQPLLVQWTADGPEAWDERLRTGSGIVITPLRRSIPERLAEALLTEAAIHPGRPLHQLRREERRRLVDLLTRYPLPWTGDEGYGKAEVTGGGVALAEIDPRTLESRRHPGLFLCGEILDAFGPIGGHNFAWAWATGRAAGRGAALRYA